jgi:uncharacterized protein YndB with AHSA1/START domain
MAAAQEQDSFEMSTTVPASPQRVYAAWLDSEQHGSMTGGGPAEVDPVVGGRFSAWDGYISGQTLELEPPRRMLQAWRTTEFPDGSADSLLEVLIEPAPGGARLTLRHSKIPAGQSESYRKGWQDYYFKPMREYFGAKP